MSSPSGRDRTGPRSARRRGLKLESAGVARGRYTPSCVLGLSRACSTTGFGGWVRRRSAGALHPELRLWVVEHLLDDGVGGWVRRRSAGALHPELRLRVVERPLDDGVWRLESAGVARGRYTPSCVLGLSSACSTTGLKVGSAGVAQARYTPSCVLGLSRASGRDRTRRRG